MTKNRRVLFLLPVLAIAGWLALFGNKTPSSGAVAQPVDTAPASDAAVDEASSVDSDAMQVTESSSGSVSRLHDRVGLVKYENLPQVDLFQGRPVAQIKEEEQQKQQKESPPPPPPEKPRQPFRVIGRMFEAGEWSAFLEHAGRTYVAHVDSIVEGFRVTSVNDQQLKLTNLGNHAEFVIKIGDDKKEPEDE